MFVKEVKEVLFFVNKEFNRKSIYKNKLIYIYFYFPAYFLLSLFLYIYTFLESFLRFFTRIHVRARQDPKNKPTVAMNDGREKGKEANVAVYPQVAIEPRVWHLVM